ncbi:P-loop containing nucleoside triphosphate hydrolase protein, partial [Endogone sp. FLAS-F59071]
MGINLVKLSAWEEPMQRRINDIRANEIAYVRRANALRAVNEALFFFFPAVVSTTTFITFWALGNQLSPDNVFTSITLFNVIRLTMTNFFPKVGTKFDNKLRSAIETISESRISAQRITQFLLLPELRHIDDDGSTSTSPSDPENILELLDASFTWHLLNSLENNFIDQIVRIASKRDDKPHESVSKTINEMSDNFLTSGSKPKNVLKNLNFGLGQKELLAVVGPTSLCMALLRELPLTQGTFKIKHPSSGIPLKIAYASQSPWILAGTIRDNIIFGEQYDEKRFREVVRVCELERDLSLFVKAENELIGEKGVTLSGGQRARVSLARSIYTDADLYVMDDPLSAVDPSVGRSLFENCICRYLSGKPRVLVTHQLQYIKDCDRVLVLEHGKATHYGPVAQVMEADIDKEKDAGKPHKKFLDVLREFAADVDVDAECMETVIDEDIKCVDE